MPHLFTHIAKVGIHGKELKYFCESPEENDIKMDDIYDGLLTWRALSMLKKEPETIKWLDSMEKGDVLWDIGACVGGYSIYTAVIKRCRVIAFEPFYENFYILEKNIELNKVQDIVLAYPMAVGESNNYHMLGIRNGAQGCSGNGAMSSPSETRDPKNFRRITGCVMDSMDNMVDKGMPYPTHIKIDVDGIEPEIINGGLKKVIPQCKSILVELEAFLGDQLPIRKKVREGHKKVIDILLSMGFKIDAELYEISARTNDDLGHYSGDFVGMRNVVFSRFI